MENSQESLLKKLESENLEVREKNYQLQTALSSSNFNASDDKNAIEYQLEVQEMLTMLEHFLKGDYVSVNDKGDEYWKTQTDKDLVLLNEYGVNSIMVIVGSYISKDTALSRYDPLRINEILADVGDELNRFIFCNYERMGMDTQFKKSRFGLLVIMIVHKIETAYRRALGGRTSEDINTSKIFTESNNLGAVGYRGIPQIPDKKRWNPFNPKTW